MVIPILTSFGEIMKITTDITWQGWIKLNSEDDLIRIYPKPALGRYRPQPHQEPERYPCYFKEVAFQSVSDGPDESILAYIYDFEETD